jgi:hypothetical protein
MMMSVESNQKAKSKTPAPETANDMLDAVHRNLVQIHAAMVERTSSDREIKPWAQRELMDVIREIGAFRRARDVASESETTAPTSSPLSR